MLAGTAEHTQTPYIYIAANIYHISYLVWKATTDIYIFVFLLIKIKHVNVF